MREKEGAFVDSERVPELPEPHRCPWLLQYLLVSPLRRLAESPEKIVGPHVKPGMTVLDAGCGFGYFSLPMARMVGGHGRIIAVDIEPRAVAHLVRRARKAGVADRIDARCSPARELDLADYDRRVDLVTAIHTLHEFEDLPGFLRHVASLLKPTGHLLVVEPGGHVTREQFAAEIQCCQSAGFREQEAPRLGRKRLAALFCPPERRD